MSDADRDSTGDEGSGHGTHVIPDEVPPPVHEVPEEGNQPAPLAGFGMEELMRHFAESMTQHLQRPRGQSSRPRRSSRPSRKAALLSEFQRFDPPRYCGDEGPEAADAWILDLENLFEAMDCRDKDKVTLAAYNLKGEAGYWWKAAKGVLGDSAPVAWKDFKQMFLDYYFPFSVKEAKAVEFERLVQGSMTVIQYARKFAELSRFAPYLVQNPVERTRRFMRGLNPDIRMHLESQGLEDFDAILHRAQVIERTIREAGGYRPTLGVSSSSSGGKRQFQGRQADQGPSKRFSSSGSGSGSRGSSSGRSDGRSRWSSRVPICAGCGTQHWGKNCVGGSPVCFRCRQPGHIRRDCPLARQISTDQSQVQAGPPRFAPALPAPARSGPSQRARGRGPVRRPPAQGQVFALTQREADDSDTVLSGA